MTLRRASPFLNERPPHEEVIRNEADYFLHARASRENGKATFDLLFEDGDFPG